MKNVFSKPAHAGTDLYQRKWVVGSVVGLLLLALFLLPGLGGAGDAVSSKVRRRAAVRAAATRLPAPSGARAPRPRGARTRLPAQRARGGSRAA